MGPTYAVFLMASPPSTSPDTSPAIDPPTEASADTAFAPSRWYRARDLIITLVAKEFKVRYKSTALGYVWSILHPLLFALVFFFVFKIIMRLGMEYYSLFLIAGLFPWHWFQNSLTMSNHSFVGNASLIKKIRFPRSLLVLSGVLNDLLHFMLALPVIVAFMMYYTLTSEQYNFYPSLSWLWLIPLMIGVQFLFTQGMSLAVATSNLFFRDLERLIEVLMMAWFYFTPILYPLDMIPPGYRWTTYVNPMANIILSWRDVFLDGTVSPTRVLVALAYGIVAFLVGYGLYRRFQWRFAEIV